MPNKTEEKPSQTASKTGLFSKPNSSLFAGKEKETPKKQESAPLFQAGGSQSKTGLFGTPAAEKNDSAPPKQQTDNASATGTSSLFGGGGKAPAGSSLFGGSVNASGGGSLFGGAPKPAAATGQGSLFGANANPPTGSLFGGNTTAAGGSLFGNNKGGFTGGSLFGGPPRDFSKPTGSLFDASNNMFASQQTKPPLAFGNSKNDEENDDNDSNENYQQEDEPPTVVLGEAVSASNPFSKRFEKSVDKFKLAVPEKKSLGAGKVSISCATFGEGDKAIKVYKLVFRNGIGKALFEGDINWKCSKIKVVPEKSAKNQIKVLTTQLNKQDKKLESRHCLINFQRQLELAEFEKEFKAVLEEAKKAAAK